MFFPNVHLTPALAAWLTGAHDDGQPPLVVVEVRGMWSQRPRGIDVRRDAARFDDQALSPTEEREVRALLSAHAAEPLTMPTK